MSSRLRRLNIRHVLPDVCLIAFSLYFSFYLRVGPENFVSFLPILTRWLPIVLAFRLGAMIVNGSYDIIWRFISLKDAAKLFKASLAGSFLVMGVAFFFEHQRLPHAIFVIDTILSAGLLFVIRFCRRLAYEKQLGEGIEESGRATLVYGAGSSGRALVSRLATDKNLGYNAFGFIDDDPQKLGRFVAGHKVLGTKEQLEELLRAYNIRELIIAIPNLSSGALLREIYPICQAQGVRPRIVSAQPTGEASPTFDITREIDLADLLGRPPRQIDLSGVRGLVQNRCLLVTGAGGSIGSELCRQLLSYGPKRLLLLDHSEYNLYEIDRELSCVAKSPTEVVPLLIDVRTRAAVENVFETYRPEVVLHAAAYKHVHLVESNPLQAILNNVLGTLNVIELSVRHGVKSFTLISTDKAVRPRGVMGQTKRICELLVADAGKRTGDRYSSVRFGNVLGSSGSLIPLLRKQIEKGESLTITHQDMTRYFMLIPEAVSLVLKAATIARSYDIFILKMGEPIRIVDIAKSLIALMGRREDDVRIVFTGVRPGEKLFEELYIKGDELRTEDVDILVAPRGESHLSESGESAFRRAVDLMAWYAEQGDGRAVELLRILVTGGEVSGTELDEAGRSGFFAPHQSRSDRYRPEVLQ